MDNKMTVFLGLLIVAAGGFSWHIRWSEAKPPSSPDFSRIPLLHDGWSGEVTELTPEEIEILRATSYRSISYHGPGETRLELFVGYFASQKFGASIHSPKNCLPGSGWLIAAHDKTKMALGGQSVIVNRLVIVRGQRRQAVYYWYQTRAGSTDSEIGLKLDLARSALLGRPTDCAMIRLIAPLEQEAQILAFLQIFGDDILGALPFRY